MVFCLFSATDCSFLWPVSWQVVRGSRCSGSYGMVLVHRQSNPRGAAARSGGSTCSEPPCRTPGRVSSHPRLGNNTLSWTGGGHPQSPPGPRDSVTLGSEQVYCMLSWPKLRGKQAGEMTLRGREGELLEVPWPQVTASELRPDDLRTFSAGGRGSRQGHKRQ